MLLLRAPRLSLDLLLSAGGAEGFDPEALGDLLLWVEGADLGEPASIVEDWENQAAGGPMQLDSSPSAGTNVVVSEAFGPKTARCESAAISYMESNAALGWSGADFYMAAVLAVDDTSSNGDAQVLNMNAGTFAVIIGGSGEVIVRIGDNPFSFVDAVYPGGSLLFLLEAWREDGEICCAINGVDSTSPQEAAAMEADAVLLAGNTGSNAGMYLGELLFYDGMISDRAALRAYLNDAFGL
jgi:hypothetical protein